ncbi:hypothetical protein PAE9249_01934 [Paenibacillus sp. CECT 9249]|uniref:VanZ family protein n=1 Tax=Paenibacillus sp. CECT 9249 TaxID=2845385 RepID=UPI001E324882|nr:VanZ family protein [Paenibacillus sp. CECT 9249]CAH0119431.1 hypothetical protein PAE9249_01934 [Paenibacillus sp. CECT 9249]
MNREKRSALVRLAAWIILIGYGACLLYWMFVGFGRTALSSGDLSYNLIPLRTISDYFLHYQSITFRTWAINIIGNIGVFVPIGAAMPVVFPKCRTYFPFLGRFAVAIVVLETLQTFLRAGSGDVDDLILNAIGASAGYILYKLYARATNKDPLNEDGNFSA